MAKKKKKKISPVSALERLEQIKKLAVISMFSDDLLMERLVLKGGNALDLIHRISTRSSIDVDLSMDGDFQKEEWEEIRRRVKTVLTQTFRDAGYEIFDLQIEEVPEGLTPDLADFWGGYGVDFKLIENAKYSQFADDIDQLRRNALAFNPGSSVKFTIDISKFEYTLGKEPKDLEGYRIFVYSPIMIVCEKLRAICQQMTEYGAVVKRNRAGASRAKDFVDIYTIMTTCALDPRLDESRLLLAHMFEAKRVPLTLLDLIPNYREYHRLSFPAVTATVKPDVELESFNFYFDFVVALVNDLHTKKR